MPPKKCSLKMENNTLLLYVLILWGALTLLNIGKAYHIDDAFHIEAAHLIQQDPLRPMSGSINWADTPAQLIEHNQPPLFFYLIVVTQNFFGESELVMHLMLSVFTFMCLYYFLRISSFLGVQNIRFTLTIFAFCPAFVVNQNLMTDIPILALSLGAMYFLLRGLKEDDKKNLFFSVTYLSIGLLIKYTLLPLFLVILISIIFTSSFKKLLILFIPITVLFLWAIWNVIEIDTVHLLSRPRGGGVSGRKVLGYLGTLGSVSFFTMAFIQPYFKKQSIIAFVYLIVAILSVSAPLVYFEFIHEEIFNKYINYLFIGNGLLLTVLIGVMMAQTALKEKMQCFRTPQFTMALFVAGISTFIILFAPFNATRHVLLIIPFLILIGYRQIEEMKGIVKAFVLFLSVGLGVLLGISDWIYADFYRKSAAKIEVRQNTWSIGHWGWQYYSQKAGMKIYSTRQDSEVNIGDLFIFPTDISKQKLSTSIKLDTIEFITETPDMWTFFSGKNFASMYNSDIDKPAWSLSKCPIDTIFVCRVTQTTQ